MSFFTFFTVLKNLLFHSSPWFSKTHHIYVIFEIILYIKIQRFSVHYLKKLEVLNRLCSFMNQFIRYIHGKVCSYPVLNIFAKYI